MYIRNGISADFSCDSSSDISDRDQKIPNKRWTSAIYVTQLWTHIEKYLTPVIDTNISVQVKDTRKASLGGLPAKIIKHLFKPEQSYQNK